MYSNFLFLHCKNNVCESLNYNWLIDWLIDIMDFGEVFLVGTVGSPKRAKIAPSCPLILPQSQQRIWFILPAHRASHITISVNQHCSTNTPIFSYVLIDRLGYHDQCSALKCFGFTFSPKYLNKPPVCFGYVNLSLNSKYFSHCKFFVFRTKCATSCACGFEKKVWNCWCSWSCFWPYCGKAYWWFTMPVFNKSKYRQPEFVTITS